MKFPLSITANINSHEGDFSRDIELRDALTFIIGPNGSGKTHLLKGLKNSFGDCTNKKVRFISAGRLGPLERYRSKGDSGLFDVDKANHGNKYKTVYRHEIETIDGDLHTLAARPDILIKVRERLQKLFKRNITIDWDAGELKVSFSRLERNSPYSSGREASGLLHLVGILSALYDDEVGVLLIDEPEVSLHPQLQAFLLKEISRVAGIPNGSDYKKIIVMATHSTEMIKISKADDLLSFVFCNDLKEEPIQIPKNAGELKSDKIKSLVKRLGQEHKLALFSRTPLLVEGPSDVIICNTLSDKLYLNLEAAGSQILPINGKGAMPETIKLFRLMGKTPTVLVDIDAFADDIKLVSAYFNNCNNSIIKKANILASKNGASKIMDMIKNIYNDFCSLINNVEGHNDRRLALCALFSGEKCNDEKYQEDWVSLKNRLNALFEIFEDTGLFILRKGTIESYYNNDNQITDKVDNSIVESEYIFKLPEKEVEYLYKDILNCLRYASNNEVIDESKIIRDELLAFSSAIHARYAEGEHNLNHLGVSSPIFNYKIDKSGKLEISINSKVLDVRELSIILNKDDDVRKVVNRSLGIE